MQVQELKPVWLHYARTPQCMQHDDTVGTSLPQQHSNHAATPPLHRATELCTSTKTTPALLQLVNVTSSSKVHSACCQHWLQVCGIVMLMMVASHPQCSQLQGAQVSTPLMILVANCFHMAQGSCVLCLCPAGTHMTGMLIDNKEALHRARLRHPAPPLQNCPQGSKSAHRGSYSGRSGG